jgi:hypothetical protein
MAYAKHSSSKQPTKKQIADLVGGEPLDYAFNPETGALCVISPTGQKFRFTPQDWQKRELPDVEKPEPLQEAPSKPKKARRSKPDTK